MSRKALLLLFSLAAVIAVIALASSLHDVTFQPGRPFTSDSTPTNPFVLPALTIPTETPLWKILLFWALALINVVLFIWLLPPEVRKRLLRQVLGFAVGVLALILALKYNLITLPQISAQPAPTEEASGTSGTGGTAPIPFQPPQMPPWMIYLTSLLAVLFLALVILLIYRRWFRPAGGPVYPLKAIADIAQTSLRDLAAGRSWGDVIVECYVSMSDAVSARRGLLRPDSTTPREFAARLTHAGLPADAVNRLTGLFESVRYGSHRSSEADIRAATDCLNAILRACGTGT